MNKNVLRIIFSSVKKQKLVFVGIIIALTGAIVFALVPPLILARIIDIITAGNSLPMLLILVYFGFTVLTGLSESIREGLLTVLGQRITHSLRSAMMDKYTHLTADCLTNQEPGAVVSRFVGDVDTVENLFTSGIISMFADAFKIISILVVVGIKNTGLAIVLVILLPFIFWFTRMVQKNMLKAQIDNRQAVSRASGHVPETLHNIRTIHNCGAEKYMTRKYNYYIEDSYKAMEKTNFYDAVYSPVILILNALVVAVVMLLSASGNVRILSLFGMSAGTAVAVINYISQIFSPIESLGMEIQTIQSAIAGVHRIDDFLSLDELDIIGQEADNPEKKSDGGDDFYVDFRNVTFAYESQQVLNNFSFHVKKGEQVTLLGRTGSGKSTIFKLLLGIYKPQTGQIYIDGRRADSITDSERRKTFGYVEQSFHMVPGTVADQIALYDESISLEDVREAAKLAGIDKTIMEFENGYDTPCSQELFSQGQWQLLSIARAVAAKPKLLLLDEITANLDVQTEECVMQAMKRASADRTVISISHRINAQTGRIINLSKNEEMF
ncbi:MAG: ABC transporter ATP-binding protein [Clostridia bacterium]|nr:ABC transporter ATP-binding protein [Clostridia bacterium]